MCHEGFVERFLYLVSEILVVDMNHRPLAQRSQRFVRRLSRVDPYPHLFRIG